MKYFLDAEFHEYQKQPKVLGLNVGKPIDTIELISIGIVSEDIVIRNNITKEDCYKCSTFGTIGCELCTKDLDNSKIGGNPSYHCYDGKDKERVENKKYYAICKDFNLKAAWNNEWLRRNVLKQIVFELYVQEYSTIDQIFHDIWKGKYFGRVKYLINKYGKTRKQIAEEIIEFINPHFEPYNETPEGDYNIRYSPIEFYAYFADYDWVVFCWLFGRMIDLPKGFPMYCRDLKQELDTIVLEKCSKSDWYDLTTIHEHKNYPKQSNEHNALADALWNKELYKFLTKI